MKSLTLQQQLLRELGSRCGVSTDRDFKTVADRVEKEGMSFLTISLPAFCADFERSLDLGCVAPDAFPGFHRPRRARGLPAFLRGFLELIFDPAGVIFRDVTPLMEEAIYAVRQICLAWGKILIPCSDARVTRSFNNYITCEEEVRIADRNFDLVREDFGRISNLLFARALTVVDYLVYNGELIPRHGPGATADRVRGNAKFEMREWTDRLELLFPYGDYALPNWRFSYRLDDVTFFEPGQERPVRIISVPKTLKTPRIIGIEPSCMQYMQQSVANPLRNALEADDYIGGRNGMIGFTDQTPNQRMACEGSRPFGRALATLDLSEASDRVSNQHVSSLCGNRFPWFKEAVQACRSLKADVPGHGVIPLAKYASMGSALTFPLEAMVFLTACFMGIERELKRPLRLTDIRHFRQQVRVYGDDIIVPVEFVTSVIEVLDLLGLKTNLRKSFWRGLFRESCGREFFNGTDVSIVRVRREIPESLTDVEGVVSTVSLRNQLYQAGLWSTAALLDTWLEPLLRGFYPSVAETSAILGRQTSLATPLERWDHDLQRPLVKGFVVSAPLPYQGCSGEAALVKVLLSTSDEPITQEDHLERSGRPRAVNLKLRWAPPY